MVTDTSIAISTETKKRLEAIKVHPRETYEDIILRLLNKMESGVH